MNPDEMFQSWTQDLEAITQDVYELFTLRRTFRDVAEVFRNNPRLQTAGGHLWTWMLMNYVANVLMRVRRLVDGQNKVVSLKRLMHSIIDSPEVMTRRRRRMVHGEAPTPFLQRMIDGEFTNTWVRDPRGDNSPEDHVDPTIVAGDLQALEAALEGVAEFAHRTIAHKTRVVPGEITFAEIDAAFTAIEGTIQKYHALILGVSLLQAEPVPQFNTREVFTFPWIQPAEGTE